MKKKEPPTCYECGVVLTKPRKGKHPLRPSDRSDDHIPPECLFSGDDRNTNLITVSCCHACNSGHAKEDEALMWMIMDVRNRKLPSLELFKSTFHTLTKGNLRHYRSELEAMVANAPVEAKVELMRLPANRKAILSRMVKGLLYKFYGLRGFNDYMFRVFEIEPEARDAFINTLQPTTKMLSLERGNGVFRANGFPDPADPRSGLFCLQFFQGGIQCVLYKSRQLGGSFPTGDIITLLDAMASVLPSTAFH